MSWKRSLWFRLTVGAIAVIGVANAALAVVTVQAANRLLLDEVQTRVRLDLNTARAVYDARLQRLADLLRAAAVARPLPAVVGPGRLGGLDQVLDGLRGVGRADLAVLLDPTGRVLYRSHRPEAAGDDMSSDPVIARALTGDGPVSGTVVVAGPVLAREGEAWAAQARFSVLETPAARPSERAESSDGMLAAAALSLRDPADRRRVVAVLYVAELLDRRNDLVDEIRELVFRGQTWNGRSIGTATLFQGDLRVATNVRARDGARAVGTRMSAAVADRVLGRGEVFADRAFVVNDWYLTAYEPLRDPAGRVVGALYVGLLEAPFRQRDREATTGYLLAAGAATLASLALLFFLVRVTLRPVGRIVEMADRVIAGDLAARVGIRPPGEMGALCRAIDQMAEAVEQREERLEAAARERISHSDKLASVGKLAAGVAHEVNNPLTGVLTFAHLMRGKENLDDEDRQSVDVILRETTRVREIVRGLLDYARETPAVMRAIDANDVVRQALELVRKQKSLQKLTLRETLHPERLPVWGDRNRLSQVLLNLLLNAADAMPNGGTLSVSTGLRDGKVFLAVADTGSGIRPEDRARIFEPFFTTKAVGSGTGLGLSVSLGIVQQHRGSLDVQSEPGQGATFTVLLPAGESPPADPTPAQAGR